MQQKGPEQDRQRWEALIAKRLAEDAPEQDVVQELVAKGADLQLARDFVRRIAERQPQSKPEVQAASQPKRDIPIDAVIGMILATVGIVATILLYIMDLRSWGAYAGYAATLVGLVLVGRRALTARS